MISPTLPIIPDTQKNSESALEDFTAQNPSRLMASPRSRSSCVGQLSLGAFPGKEKLT